jgi:hypothetical protein
MGSQALPVIRHNLKTGRVMVAPLLGRVFQETLVASFHARKERVLNTVVSSPEEIIAF